jgi:phage terminase small subunit
MQKVCLLYLKGANLRQALLQAGYSEAYALHHASKFLRSRAVQKFIRERQAQAAQADLADLEFIKYGLFELAESPDPAIRLAAYKQLDAHHEWQKELAAKIAAIEQTQKLPPPATTPVTININEVK